MTYIILILSLLAGLATGVVYNYMLYKNVKQIKKGAMQLISFAGGFILRLLLCGAVFYSAQFQGKLPGLILCLVGFIIGKTITMENFKNKI